MNKRLSLFCKKSIMWPVTKALDMFITHNNSKTCMRQPKQLKKNLLLWLRGLDIGSLHRSDPNRGLHHRHSTVSPKQASAAEAGNRKKRYNKHMKEHLVGRHASADDQSQPVLRLRVKTSSTNVELTKCFRWTRMAKIDSCLWKCILTQASRGAICKTDLSVRVSHSRIFTNSIMGPLHPEEFKELPSMSTHSADSQVNNSETKIWAERWRMGGNKLYSVN